VPEVADLDELNRLLRTQCEAERHREVHSLFGPFVIKDRLAEDLAAAGPLPAHQFDPCVTRPAVAVDKYQTIAFDCNRYSVPRTFAFQMVAVHGYVDRVVITARGQVVATHTRCLQKHEMILDPIHYLATLGRKPGALDHSPVFRDWNLPVCFANFRAELERHHGAMGGSRRFALILQLMAEHPMSRVTQAIEACQREHLHSAEAVIQRTKSLAAIEAKKRDVAATSTEATTAIQVDVPLPDLSRFNELLSRSAADSPVSVFFA